MEIDTFELLKYIATLHIHVHTYTAVNCLCKVQSSITKTSSGGQTLNFEKKSNVHKMVVILPKAEPKIDFNFVSM